MNQSVIFCSSDNEFFLLFFLNIFLRVEGVRKGLSLGWIIEKEMC